MQRWYFTNIRRVIVDPQLSQDGSALNELESFFNQDEAFCAEFSMQIHGRE